MLLFNFVSVSSYDRTLKSSIKSEIVFILHVILIPFVENVFHMVSQYASFLPSSSFSSFLQNKYDWNTCVMLP